MQQAIQTHCCLPGTARHPVCILETPVSPIPCLQVPYSTWLPGEVRYFAHSSSCPLEVQLCQEAPHLLPPPPHLEGKDHRTHKGSSADGRELLPGFFCFPNESSSAGVLGESAPRRLPSVFISTDVGCCNTSSVVPRKHWRSLVVTGSSGYLVPPVEQSF